MARERKCILCEMVCSSKQEMEEHIRSMLHHRELEKLKGRDCGHECNVCRVTVVSLTDYASHISDPTHKRNVEAAEDNIIGNDQDLEYFDQTLVDLIERRKEMIRKEEEAATAKQVREEEDQRRKREFQQRLKEAKERFQLDGGRRQPPRGYAGSSCQGAWNGNNPSGRRGGGAFADSRPGHNGKQGKSATWHAQEPPDLSSWQSGEWAVGSSHRGQRRGDIQLDKGAFSGSPRGRHPWLSNRGSSNGVYGRNNIPQFSNRALSLLGPLASQASPQTYFSRSLGQIPSQCKSQGGRLGDGHYYGEGPSEECIYNGDISPKTFGSNPKLDKAFRWSPYPPTKTFDPLPQKETHTSTSERHLDVPTPQKQEKAPDASTFSRQSQFEEKSKHVHPCGERKKQQRSSRKHRDKSNSGSRSGSMNREGRNTTSPGPSKQNADKPSEQNDRKLSMISWCKAKLNALPTPQQKQPKAASKQHSRFSTAGPLQLRQEQKRSEKIHKSKETVLEMRGSTDLSSENIADAALHIADAALHIVEERIKDGADSQVGANKENNCSQDSVTDPLPNFIRASPCGEENMEVVSPADSSQILQSVQVTTSSISGSELVTMGEGDQEEGSSRALEAGGLEVSDEAGGLEGSDEAAQAGEDAQNASGSGAQSLSKLGLPPVLKRDLTKHINAKGKTGSHEPNLNSARRVRNVSESRKGETEKESGLKPTVRQLISSSGSRRNVNWEQVYQEVRKKQGQGKGMPRFGIEMVSYDHEEQCQEEDNVTLLQGFQWESLMDGTLPVTTRKRSLSESSVAPSRTGSSHSLFPPHVSGDAVNGESLSQPEIFSPEQLETVYSPSSATAPGSRTNQQPGEGVQKGRVKALQRSDSALGDSSSGTELYDAQGPGKKRRAAGDIPTPEIPSLERKNKRMKVKSKRERFQVDQLLAVSLREEELSHSLQTVDNNLIQARATLQAAYMEVQRLMVLKQQVTTEMGTLRNKRIELLKGMQGGFEDAAQPKVKDEARDSAEFQTNTSTNADLPHPCQASQPPRGGSPPPARLPTPHVVVKHEPLSPVHISPEPVENHVAFPRSTTPKLPAPPHEASHPDAGHSSQMLTERKPELCQAEPRQDVHLVERAVQTSRDCPASPPDSKLHLEQLTGSRRSSEAASLTDAPAAPTLPPSSSELRGGKRVRRLKKRRALKKAQGSEQPATSDTEVEEDVLRQRRIQPRRRPSGGSQASASSPPTALEDEEAGGAGLRAPREEDLDSPLEMVELSLTAPSEVVNVDTSEPEEAMEVNVSCQQPQTDAPPPSDCSGAEPHSLACNEVTSTSDMEVSSAARPCQRDVQMPLESAKTLKMSSDVSSGPGEDEVPTEGAFEGHSEAVNGMQIHKGLLYTCSGDRTVRAFNLVNHKCVSVFEGHTSKVNCLLVSALPGLPHRLYSGSSDQTIRCYSLKTRLLEQQISLPDRVLCLHSRWKVLYAGLANGTVVTFNLKNNRQLDVFECHGPRAVSCLASAQEGARKVLLVGSYDSTISVRDGRSGLLLRTLQGHTKTVLCMKVVNDLVFSGSSDQSVHAHNIHTGELVRIYKGHSHAVTVVAILGKVMVTASLDKLVRVYELQSHDRLQVYGGHRDMVMCMSVHKSMIYTGCYDGSVQATKLNLMQNYRCSWHGCSLIFGVVEHLQQHLLDAHASPGFQTLKCRWKNCDEFFRSGSKQGMLTHMQKHAEEAAKSEP